MADDLSTLPPEGFFRLAVARGGLDLEDVIQDLGPEAAEALRRIAAAPRPVRPQEITRSAPSRGLDLSAGTRYAEAPVCPACGRLNQAGDHYCRTCGRPLARAASPPVTLASLVAEGQLSPEQAQAALDALVHLQSEYTAGTRYSVFGPGR